MVLPVGFRRRHKPRGDGRERADARVRLRTLSFRWFLLYPRVCIAAAGYAVIAIFAVGFGVASAIGVPFASAMTVGIVAAAPIVIAVIGERVTSINAFGVGVTLTEVTPPIAGDHTQVAATLSQSLGQGKSVMQTSVVETSAVGSEGEDLSGPLRELREKGSKVLHIDLKNENYWWSTRIFLVAALAEDYTDVDALVFVRWGESRDQQMFVGIASPRDVRKRFAKTASSDKYETAYRRARRAAVSDSSDPDSELIAITKRWPSAVSTALGKSEVAVMEVVSSTALRRWLGRNLDTQSVPAGPLTPLKQFRIISHDRRYVALTDGQHLEEVVDRDEVVVAAQLDQRIGKRWRPTSGVKGQT